MSDVFSLDSFLFVISFLSKCYCSLISMYFLPLHMLKWFNHASWFSTPGSKPKVIDFAILQSCEWYYSKTVFLGCIAVAGSPLLVFTAFLSLNFFIFHRKKSPLQDTNLIKYNIKYIKTIRISKDIFFIKNKHGEHRVFQGFPLTGQLKSFCLLEGSQNKIPIPLETHGYSNNNNDTQMR